MSRDNPPHEVSVQVLHRSQREAWPGRKPIGFLQTARTVSRNLEIREACRAPVGSRWVQNLHARDLNPSLEGRDRADLTRQPHDDLSAQGTARSALAAVGTH